MRAALTCKLSQSTLSSHSLSSFSGQLSLDLLFNFLGDGSMAAWQPYNSCEAFRCAGIEGSS